jgi:glucosamine-6-phosphate deaminase
MSRMDVRIHASAGQAVRELAEEVRELINRCRSEGRPPVLGLATGNTPLPFYLELVRLHREEGLSFRDVVTFNLDEYLGLPAAHPRSYRAFMRRHFFDQVDIDPGHTHIPDGMVPTEEVPAHCEAYEMAIAEAGGIDLQILGIGRTGHIGFNEPGWWNLTS